MVAIARTEAHVVSEELTDRPNPNVKLVGLGIGKRAFDAVDGWCGGSWIGLALVLALVG